jgi:putative hemolysin
MSFLVQALQRAGDFLIRLSRFTFSEKKKRPESKAQEEQESLTQTLEEKEAVLDQDEKKMIHGIFELGETEVKEIMVPRIDMICVEQGGNLEQIKEIVRKKGHSRIPLYKDNIDNITGIIYIKDLFLEETRGKKFVNLNQLARKAYFIPESKKVDELLRELKKNKIHIAIVLDEYGGTAGLVTLEDVLEEIVGEIQDEYDTEEASIQKLDEKTFRVDARLSIEELNEQLNTDIAQNGFETVGGFIYDLVGSVPEEGKILKYEDLKIRVEKVIGQRIKTVKVTKEEKEIPDTED